MTIPPAIIRVLNPVMKALLRSPLHGMASTNIMLITFTGRKSGRQYTTPVSYVREGQTVRCFTHADTPWWRNLRDGGDVTLRIRGGDVAGRAEAIHEDPKRATDALQGFLRQVPRDAGYYDVAIGAKGEPNPGDLERAGEHTILIETQLETPLA